MMLTKENLDNMLPVDMTTLRIASNVTGVAPAPDWMERALRWMADFVEGDFHSWGAKDAPAWRKDPTVWRSGSWWDITADGLEYKSTSRYLTAEGWPLSTQCWFVRIECGFRLFAACEEPLWALARGVIVMTLLKRWRAIDPNERPHLMEFLIDECEKLRKDAQ